MDVILKTEIILIESVDPCEKLLSDWIDRAFDVFAEQHGVGCNYTPFAFATKKNGEVIGVVKGHSFYREVHIADLIVVEACRGQGIGTRLLETVEAYFQDKGFDNLNLTTYRFQAPDFYGKYSFVLEYVRENPGYPPLSKYFFIKELNKENR